MPLPFGLMAVYPASFFSSSFICENVISKIDKEAEWGIVNIEAERAIMIIVKKKKKEKHLSTGHWSELWAP